MHRRINFLWKLHYRYFKKLLLVVCETVFPEVNCKLAVYWISLAMQLNFHCCLQHQITNLYFIWLAKQQFVTVLTWFNRAKPGVWPITPKLMSSIIFMMLFFFFISKDPYETLARQNKTLLQSDSCLKVTHVWYMIIRRGKLSSLEKTTWQVVFFCFVFSFFFFFWLPNNYKESINCYKQLPSEDDVQERQ